MIRQLSERHQEIVRLVASGYTSKDIGLALGISYRTVENLTSRIMGELGVNSRTKLVVLAFKMEILSVDDAYATMLATFDLKHEAAGRD